MTIYPDATTITEQVMIDFPAGSTALVCLDTTRGPAWMLAEVIRACPDGKRIEVLVTDELVRGQWATFHESMVKYIYPDNIMARAGTLLARMIETSLALHHTQD